MSAARGIGQKTALVLLAAMVAGCSSSATIERRSGPTIVGHIDYMSTPAPERPRAP